MTSTLEKVARAIYYASHFHLDDIANGNAAEAWDRFGAEAQGPSFLAARSALEALKEPSEGMIRAVYVPPRAEFEGAPTPEETWAIMIDSILSEKGEG